MSDFFKELEDEIREERVVILWRKYGNLIIGLAVAIVIGTSGYTLWKYMSHQRKIKRHVSYSQAIILLNQGKKEEALVAFQALAKEGGGYGKLAQLYEASLVSNPDEVYTKIATQYVSDPAMGNLPKVLRGAREIGNSEAMLALEPLSAPHNAWAPLSLELLALADLKRGDDTEAAKRYLKILKESSITTSEQVRASLMLSQIDVPQFLLDEESKKEAQQ